MTNLRSTPWLDVVAVGIRTTADGPFAEDVFWQFLLRDGYLEVPGLCINGPELDELGARLPGLDHEKIIRAMCSTTERIFRVWHREESRYRPVREELAARFRALVGRLGGDAEAAPEVFDRVHAAWSAKSRRYHDAEHLVDCLRELDASNGLAPALELVEIALWYHDLVHEPLASDCEERSAQALLRDAETFAIPAASAKLAAELVRATAHGTTRGGLGSAADLVVDIDLSILGRDVLRFMDYEHGVEEEYSTVPMASFRRGRGQFLASLLAREHLFCTERLRDRHEERARANIEALLASARYTGHGLLR